LGVIGLAASQPASPATQPITNPARATTEPTTALAATTEPAATTAPAPTPGPATATGPSTQPAVVVALGDPARLLEQLADPDWHVRRKAQDQLVRAGQDAKPFIRELVQRAITDEARKNAQSALAEIDENRLIGPSYLTLHFKNASPADVFAEISRQCFAPLPTAPDNLFQQEAFPKVTVDADHQPFWAVVPRICQQLGVDFRQYQGGVRLMRNGGVQTDGINRLEGAFLIVATQISYSRSRAFGGHAEQTQFGLQLVVYPEPKLKVLRGSGAIDVTQAQDDLGNSLIPDASVRPGWGGFMGMGGWSMFAPLHYPRNIGTRITHFRGNTSFVIQVQSQIIEIPGLASLRPTTKLVYNMEVRFEDMKKVGDAWKLHLHLNQPNFGGPDWQQFMEGVQNRMQILDADGHALDHRGMSTSANNATVDVTMDFARSNRMDGQPCGDPVRLVWEVPTKTRELTVPIEFTDLPLFDEK